MEGMRKLVSRFGATSVTEVVLWKKGVNYEDVARSHRIVSHKQVGGITTGQWVVCTTKVVEQRWHLSKVRRTLKHLLKSTNPGRRVLSPSGRSCKGNGMFTGSGRIPFGVHSVWVETPNCILQALVQRPLTTSELMDSYDIEVGVQEDLLHFWERREVEPSFAFVTSVPVKVLIAVARHLFVAEPAKVECQQGAGESEPEVVPISLDIRPMGDMETESTMGETGWVPDATAVKNDDAEVHSGAWNQWCVNSFGNPNEGRGLICVPGTYDEVAHGWLFDRIRSLLLRWYRRNVLRGFLHYMGEEHKDLGMSEVQVSTPGALGTVIRRVAIPGWVNCRMVKPSGLAKKRKRLPGVTDSDVWGHSLRRDLLVGSDAIHRLCNSKWWSWDDGSTLLFWRWPKIYRYKVRDGSPVYCRGQYLPHYFKKQVWPKDKAALAECKRKISKVRDRRYIVPGEDISCTGFIAVPQGTDDIRMVYDATKCGLNAAVWAPNFGLPTIDSVLRNADGSTWFGDIDLGEMFLNYFLDERLRSYAGVDVRGEFPDSEGYERWERSLMGFRPSPFLCTQTFGWGEDVIRGDRHALDNPFRWDKVVLNLPGSQQFDPCLPWVYRWDSVDSRIASFFETYMDDIRTGGASEALTWEASRRVASVVQYLGQQDAPRKRRPPSQTPGAWAGAMCLIDGKGNVLVTCSEEKWLKGKRWILAWHDAVCIRNVDSLEFKELEKGVGFLVYLSRTFPMIFPYLKGLYHTMNEWRVGRDRDGWKYSTADWKELLALEDVKSEDVHVAKREYVHRNQPPKPARVKPVPRLYKDLEALRVLFDLDVPPKRLVRGRVIQSATYGFGDASGGGFGSTWDSDKGVKYRFGTWGEEEDGSSSNFRELKNLVETLEDMGRVGDIQGMEIFLFTDNSTSESAFFNGSSSSEKLHALILRVRLLELRCKCCIHLVHVSGERMIQQGTDGLSRGNLSEGVLKGDSIGSFVPIHVDPLSRAPTLTSWLKTWVGKDAEFLSPEDWFGRGHDLVENQWEVNFDGINMPRKRPGTFIWSPAPAAGQAAVEELRKARHKGQLSKHLVVIPRLMQPYWRKILGKACDLVISLPTGHPAWPKGMFEPLTLGFCLPYLSFDPWEIRRSPLILDLGSRLSEVWRTGEGSEGPLLRELWSLQTRLETLSSSLAREMLYGKRKLDVSHSTSGKRRRDTVEEDQGRWKISKG